MELNHIKETANDFMEQFDLHSKGWRFTFCNALSYIGQCNYRNKEIKFSKKFADIPYKEIKDTVLHEIAHALDKERNGVSSRHGAPWKRIAMEIGARPTSQSHSTDVQETVRKQYKYIVECPTHGFIGGLTRRTKGVRNNSYVCRQCGAKAEVLNND